VVPVWFVPFAERTALAQASQERKMAVEAAEAALKAQEEAQVMARNSLWESMSEEEREVYCSVALAALPTGLAPSMAVTAMAKTLALEAKQTSNHDCVG
jgi:Tfp pilus assembly protein PilX